MALVGLRVLKLHSFAVLSFCIVSITTFKFMSASTGFSHLTKLGDIVNNAVRSNPVRDSGYSTDEESHRPTVLLSRLHLAVVS